MKTKQLILLRHATARLQETNAQNPNGSDFDRPLSEQGIAEASILGEWMGREMAAPELIISSSSARARETIEQACEIARWDRDLITLTRSLYLADPLTIHNIISVYLERQESIMLVGHNPGLEMTLHDYDAGLQPVNGRTLMGTGSIAVISLTQPDEGELGQGQNTKWKATVEQLLQKEELANQISNRGSR